jgi:flagellar motility protein MotE (MotC chaperone)
LESQIGALLKNLSEKEEAELLSLAKIYEQMKPDAAASVMERMDNRIVFDVFKRMNRKSVAKIMEKISSAKGRIISEMLAEKSDLPSFE